MTEVEQAQQALSDAQNAVSEARTILTRAERSLQLFVDAEVNAWVALKDAQWQVEREKEMDLTSTPRPVTDKRIRRRSTMDEAAVVIDKLNNKAKRREERA